MQFFVLQHLTNRLAFVSAVLLGWMVPIVSSAEDQNEPAILSREMPSWMIGREHLLPKVDPKVLEQVRKDFDTLVLMSELDAEEKKSSENIEAVRRLAKLGHETSRALVWVYVLEDRYGIELLDIDRNYRRRKRLTEWLGEDPIFGKGVLPLIRAQMTFLNANPKWGESYGIIPCAIVVMRYGNEADVAQLVDLERDYHHAKPGRGFPDLALDKALALERALESSRDLKLRSLKRTQTFSDGCWRILAALGGLKAGDPPPLPRETDVATRGADERSQSGVPSEPALERGKFASSWWPWVAGGVAVSFLLCLARRARR